jgi:hypothetical protein
MTNTSSPVDTPADSAPAEALVTPVEGQGNADARKRSKNKVVLAREPSTLDPTRYGDWEKNGRCIDF